MLMGIFKILLALPLYFTFGANSRFIRKFSIFVCHRLPNEQLLIGLCTTNAVTEATGFLKVHYLEL
jgi:hypothetical protein